MFYITGFSFTRDLLKAIIPKNCINMLDTTLYNLVKQKFFECGSLAMQTSQQRSQSLADLIQQDSGNQKTHHHHHHHHHHGCYQLDLFILFSNSLENLYFG